MIIKITLSKEMESNFFTVICILNFPFPSIFSVTYTRLADLPPAMNVKLLFIYLFALLTSSTISFHGLQKKIKSLLLIKVSCISHFSLIYIHKGQLHLT